MYSDVDQVFSDICQYGNLMASGKLKEAGLVLSEIHRKLECLRDSNFRSGVNSTKYEDEL